MNKPFNPSHKITKKSNDYYIYNVSSKEIIEGPFGSYEEAYEYLPIEDWFHIKQVASKDEAYLARLKSAKDKANE